MRTLLVILSHSGANAIVARHWPYYERAGCDILRVGREDKKCLWPDPGPNQLVWNVDIGIERYVEGANHLHRFMRVLNYCLEESVVWDNYSDFCVIEYDCIFFKPLPEHPGGFVATYAGAKSSGFLGSSYYHCPWWVDRPTAKLMLQAGQCMIRTGLIEQGFLDRWLGLMIDLYPIQVKQSPCFSENTIDTDGKVEVARLAIANGAYAIHGIKTAEVLTSLTKPE